MRILALAAAAGALGISSVAPADMLVRLTFQLETAAYPASPVYSSVDVYADIYGTADIATTSNNFLNYVTSGAYNNSIIHRSIPGFVIQGGGYKFGTPGNNSTFTAIPANAAVPLQYSASRPNILGSLSMARTSDPNSATSQFFINTADNTAALGPGGSSSDGYAVFGQVLNSASLANVTTIASVPTYDASSYINSNFTDLPLTQAALDYPYFVNITSVAALAKMGDINLDGRINIDDFLAMDMAYLRPSGTLQANNFAADWSHGDFNLDGTVDGQDYSLLMAAYRQDGGTLSDADLLARAPIAIPEPASLSLLAVGGVALLRRPRRPGARF